MKTNIKVKFKDNTECVFDANTFIFADNGFCDLKFSRENRSRLIACVSMNEIKYLIFVEVEDE
ncbi:hypothetical protein [Anaerococcus vaginalis]|uniref:hypothetical protein n=1 Tax=Anaerococcus vaginalis TaxID=33037 RepID=UPI0028FEF93C|nr:hypothetical protein [Anaerococcus vaginalis]MDU2374745.1 hypothetical protein [Anaerococcus vaginalis]